MADDRDDLDAGFEEPAGDDRDRVIAKAKAKVAVPGMLMIIASVIMFAVSISGFWITFGSGYDINLEMLTYFRDVATDPKMKDEFQKQIDIRKAADKTGEKVVNGFFGTLGLIGNAFVLVAGIYMRQLKSYPICMIGSILALILNGCCCIGLPIGIWSLVAINNREVKAGFEAMKRQAY